MLRCIMSILYAIANSNTYMSTNVPIRLGGNIQPIDCGPKLIEGLDGNRKKYFVRFGSFCVTSR